MVTDCLSILAGWRNHFCQLLNVYVLGVVRQTEIHTVPEPSAFEFDMAIEKIKKRHKSLCINKIPAE